MKLRVKNWQDFQHYKSRKPPWIKLHRAILDDYEFHCLPVASRALAPCLWLIASESDSGVIDASYEKLGFRFRQTAKEIEQAISPLIKLGFFVLVADESSDASKTLEQCYFNATLETETETERERETDSAGKPASVALI